MPLAVVRREKVKTIYGTAKFPGGGDADTLRRSRTAAMKDMYKGGHVYGAHNGFGPGQGQDHTPAHRRSV